MNSNKLHSNWKRIAILLVLALTTVILHAGSASALPTYIAPNKDDAKPHNSSGGGRPMSFIVSQADYIRVDKTYVKIYSTSNKIMLSVASADLCRPAHEVGGNRDVVNTGAVVLTANTPITKYTLTGGGGTSQSKNGVVADSARCSAGASGTQFAGSGVSESSPGTAATTVNLVATSNQIVNVDIAGTQAPVYIFTMVADWIGGNCGAPVDCGVNAFNMQARSVAGSTTSSVSGIIISQQGESEGGGLNASNFGVRIGSNSYSNTNQDPYYTDYDAYFGPECSVATGTATQVQLYDDDNSTGGGPAQDGAHPFLVRVEEAPKAPYGNNNWTGVSGGLTATPGPNSQMLRNSTENYQGVTWRNVAAKSTTGSGDANPNSNGYINLNFRVDKDKKYRFRIARLDKNNNIQFQLPYPGLYAVASCTDWKLNPETEVDRTTIYPGQTATWAHWINNIGSLPAPAGSDYVVSQKINSGAPTIVGSVGKVPSPIPPGGRFDIPGSYVFTAQPSDIGKTICQELSVNKYQPVPTTTYITSTPPPPQCVTVVRAPDREVVITMSAGPNPAGDVEAGDPASFAGSANVSGFPAYTDWGYNEVSRQQPARQTAGGCPPGYLPATATHCYRLGTGSDTEWVNARRGADGNYRCPPYPGDIRNTIRTQGTGANKRCEVPKLYTAPVTGTTWQCQYPGAPVVSSQPVCEYRCNNGTGERAYASNGSSSTPCYIRPSFTLTCWWTTPSGGRLSPDTTSAVDADGQWCPNSISQPTSVIGQTICVRYRAQQPSWNTSPEPGTRLGARYQTWGFRMVNNPTPPACTNVIGKPYVRIVGGDIATGYGAGATAAACSTGLGSVRAWNKGASFGYSGSGASLTALANQPIEDFASGQFAIPKLGNAPTALSFANTTGAYGGNWGSAVACFDASKFAATSSTAPNTNSPLTITDNQRIRVAGDVYIANNIIYANSDSWGSLADIPIFQLLVEGNIYISGAVNRLDGLYVALGGNIYTCATSSGGIVGAWGSSCENRQLVVNGSFVADKIHFGRSCGTLNRSFDDETTVYEGDGDPQNCSSGETRAAEVFNFLPDQWIRGTIGVPSSKYDAITNMPPIL